MQPDHPPDPEDYAYDLPPDRIAQTPAPERDAARLLVLSGEGRTDAVVRDLPRLLRAGDLLVLNDTRVMKARCHLRRRTGGAVEVFFLGAERGPVQALLRPARRLKPGEVLDGHSGTAVRILEPLAGGVWWVEGVPSPETVMDRNGHVPLPPYIHRGDTPEDEDRYQTVFARAPGAAAAPTAGLHLTPGLLGRLADAGVEQAWVTLHVGLGTFHPLGPRELAEGLLHEEWFSVPPETCAAVARTRARGGRVVAVGTTAVRALESATDEGSRIPGAVTSTTRLFIWEGYRFRTVDGLMTNFHLPRTSLMMLVGAFAGRERLLAAYRHAVEAGYRFYSYGDAMLVL